MSGKDEGGVGWKGREGKGRREEGKKEEEKLTSQSVLDLGDLVEMLGVRQTKSFHSEGVTGLL